MCGRYVGKTKMGMCGRHVGVVSVGVRHTHRVLFIVFSPRVLFLWVPRSKDKGKHLLHHKVDDIPLVVNLTKKLVTNF